MQSNGSSELLEFIFPLIVPIPQSSLASIAFDEAVVRITVDIPKDAELFAEMGFDSGVPPVDAFQTATQAFNAWQVNAVPLAGV